MTALHRRLWQLATASFVVVLLTLLEMDLVVVFARHELALFGAALALAALFRLDPATTVTRAVAAIQAVALFGLVSLTGTLASYAVAAATIGWHDEALHALDAALRFDWPAVYTGTLAYPALVIAGRLAYVSIFWSPLAILLGLCATGRADRAHRFIAAFAGALAVAVAIFALLPARSALFHHLGGNPAYVPATGLGHIATIEALRAGTQQVIVTSDLLGLISFPSFHAASAVLFVWAAWPVHWLRWPVLLVNAAMLAATPVEGTHYLVDLIGGCGLSLAAIVVVRRAAQPASPQAIMSPPPALLPA